MTESKVLQKRRLSDQTRLESWKAIANYLHRSVRTVRRWEGDQGLPVHRHKHSSGSSVHAYCAELDAWRNSHQQSLQCEPAPAPGKWLRFPTLAAYVVVALVAAIAGALVERYAFEDDPYRSTTIAQREAWVLIAAPVNLGGYQEVGESLRAALLRELSGGYLALPQQRIEDSLSLMRRDPKTALSPEIAREVALRDGRVSALLIPRLEQLGENYVLSVELIDPNNDQLIAYPSEIVANLRSILPAFERLAGEIRVGLLMLPDDLEAQRLPHVTTSSMSALHLYSQAYSYLNDEQPLVAHELLKLAITQDPQFASALALQAWTLKRQGASKTNYVHIAGKADQLSGQVTPQERYFIDGSHRYLSGDLVNADASFRALLEIKPDHLLGSEAVLELCLGSKPSGNCVNQRVHLANIRPADFESNLQAAWSLAAQAGGVELAAPYAARALDVWQNTDRSYSPASVARVLAFPVIRAWSIGDIEEALQQCQQLTDVLPSLPIDTQNLLVEHLVEFSTVLGRIDEAEFLLEKLPDPGKRQELRARFLFASGDKSKLKTHLASDTGFREQASALLMAISGLPEEAMALHDNLLAGGMSDAKGAVIRARVAFGDGGLATAQSELQKAVVELTLEDQAFYFVGHELLAAVLKADGQLTEAIRVLERTTPTRNDAAFNNAGLYWMMCQRQLARLYRDVNRDIEATRIEEHLRELLLLADNDFPLLTSLNDV